MSLHAGIIASIPSPSSGSINLGPLRIHAYGLMIALGVVAAVWLLGRRMEQKGIGTRDDANSIGIWAVIAGVIGARLYHVATDWSKFSHHLTNIPKIWQGGLGIPGGLIFGIAVGVWVAHRRHLPLALVADCGAPAIALAQAIGRWGNYFNQELFGRPTTLPWGLEIDANHMPAQYPLGTLFHPTFLYESIGTFALCGALLLIDKRFKVRPGHLMAYYIIGYGAIRFFVEGLRIDEAHHVGGLRWNQWVALAAVVGGAIYLIVSDRRAAGATTPTADEDVDGSEAVDAVEAEDADEGEPVDADADTEVTDDESNDVVADADDADETDEPTEVMEVESDDEVVPELPSEA